MKILILGADGYLGWSLTTHLMHSSHELLLIDNYSKRKIMSKLNRITIENISRIESKLSYVQKYNQKVTFKEIDCKNIKKLQNIFKKFKPNAVVHFAEYPSAPLSMLNNEYGWETFENNLKTTFNLASCIKDISPDCHIIKLGTMGEYGTPNIDIEEGWLSVNHKKRKETFLYPRQGSSIYHTSKIMDTDMLWLYTRLYKLRTTDLMQGPVYGLNFNSIDNKRLITSFAYDDIFGTVLNRFIVQAVSGVPLTVYGSGNQIRGYININDTLECISLALKNKPKRGELRIHNQFTEQFSVNELANIVCDSMRDFSIKVKIKRIYNPRIENEQHYYNAKNSNLRKMGLVPTKLNKKIIQQITDYVISHKKNIDVSQIHPRFKW